MIHPKWRVPNFESPAANRSFTGECIYWCWRCPSATPIIPRTRIAVWQHTLSAVDLWQSLTPMIMLNCITGKLKRRLFMLGRGLMFLRERFMRFGLGMKGVNMWLESRKDATFVSTTPYIDQFLLLWKFVDKWFWWHQCRMSSAHYFVLFDILKSSWWLYNLIITICTRQCSCI